MKVRAYIALKGNEAADILVPQSSNDVSTGMCASRTSQKASAWAQESQFCVVAEMTLKPSGGMLASQVQSGTP